MDEIEKILACSKDDLKPLSANAKESWVYVLMDRLVYRDLDEQIAFGAN